MNRIDDIMGKWHRHRELEVYLTTFDGAQHLRLHGWLKKHDVIIKSETFQKTESTFGTFMVYINDIMLEKLKEENYERGLFCDIEVMNTENDRWNLYKGISKENENIFEKIQDFMFSFQIKDKEDIERFLKQANNTSLALFKKDDSFVEDYIKTKELSYINKMKDIDLMIEAFVEEERYEDCAFLVKIKDRIQDYYINKLKLEEL